ncbi:hypothetical protein N9948_01210 [bacterium]|nr:hypothetical protein [bacterium]
MDRLLDKFIEEEVLKVAIKEKITGYLVKKKRRGTYQALEESDIIEKEIIEKVLNYIQGWLLNEFIDGSLKEKLSKEIKDSVYLELARKGYESVLKNKV